jgi:drug/metabolite transporter (DMT)-like permease
MLSSNQIGAVYMAISAVSFSIMDILVKIMSASYPTGEIVFFRGLFGLIPIFFIIPRDRYKNLFQTKKLKMHLARAFAAPVFATIFSMIILKEVIKLFRWVAIIIGLAGVVIILKPGTELFTVYSLFPLMFCLFFGIIAILIKKLSKTEPDYLIATFFTLVIIFCGSISLFFEFKMPTARDFVPLVLIGIAGSAGNIFLTMSLRKGSISAVTPIKYLSLIIATFAGVLIFDEIPYFTTYLGAALIIASSFIIFKREEIKNKKTIIARQV